MKQSLDINSCISFTLKWLQNCDDEAQAIEQAKISGLLKNDLSDLWGVDTELSEKLLQDAVARYSLLPDKDFLAQIFIGLGEMSAHSHADLKTAVEPILLHLQYKQLLHETINRVIEIYTSHGKLFSSEEVSLSKAISEAPFSWQTLLRTQQICSRLEHSSHYGICYVSQLFLNVDAEGFAKWFSNNSNDAIYSVISSISVDLVFKKEKKLISILLNKGGNVLKLLCASALMTSFERDEAPDYKGIAAQLIKSGICVGDTLWITGYLLKEAIHSWYRLKGSVKDNKARLTYLKSTNTKQSNHHTVQEKEFVEACLENISSSLDKVEKEIEKVLIEMAEIWPAKGMTPFQLEQLEPSFVGTQEIKYKLAKKLGHYHDKNKLLKDNLGDFKKYVGINPKNEITKDLLSYSEHDSELLLWTSYSFIELYKDDKKALSRRLGHLVGGYTDILNKFIDQPYIAQRQTEKWISATSRLAILHYFVLVTYRISSEHNKTDLEEIIPYAVNHILILLRKANDGLIELVNELPDKLIHELAHVIRGTPSTRHHENTIVHDQTLPVYLRALIIWGNPQLTQSNTELAKSIFAMLGEFSHSYSLHAQNMHFNQVLDVLDIAIANSLESKQQAVIISLWYEIYNNWKEVLTDAKWEKTAKWLISALKGDCLASKQLTSSNTWGNSFCSLKISNKVQLD